ncbi:MAG: alcohol dehydrogenase catalytic domain-containing protein [Methylocystis sp.]|uniref:alcohol dehydrogenase catalytic domain-containing protein n=1 Tax=Methylocystis sp. TaxID=1911079 RepID=UPI003DA60FB3
MKSLRVVVRRHGGPEVFETIEEQAPEPEPGRSEVRVRVLVAGVSFAEMLMREGLHPEKTNLPFTPGWDIVGVVEKLGDDASQACIVTLPPKNVSQG